MFKNKIKLLLIIISVSSFPLTSIMSSEVKAINTSTNADDWHFIVIGDTRQQLGPWDYDLNHYSHDNTTNPIRAALIENIVEDNPNVSFIIHTGDMVASGGEQDDWNRYFEDIAPIIVNNLTVYYAVGNHEYYTYALGPWVYGPEDTELVTYLANVDLPGNEKYYSLDIDDIHFQFINTDSEGSEKTQQLTWINEDFENNSNDFSISIFHRPMYSVRDSGRVEDAQEIRAEFDDTFQNYGVDLVLSGHDHYYYRTHRNDVYYLTVGGGGAELASNNDLSEWQDGDVFYSEYSYCNITVTSTTINVDMLIFDTSTNTTTLGDTFEISRIAIPEVPQFLFEFLIIFLPIVVNFSTKKYKKREY